MNGLIEFKNFEGNIKDVDVAKRVVTGYLSAFGNKDYDNDVVEKGAFSKSINERKDKIFFLNQHNWAQPHGKFSVLQEDDKGLYFESEPLIDTSYSSDALKLYEAGILKEHSIGFVTIKDDQKDGVRILRELKLYEGSNVTLGANPDTPFTGMKSLTLADINDKCTLLYKAIRNGDFTDETFTLLEYSLKELQFQAYELGKKSLTEPFKDTQTEPINIINEFIKSLK